MLESVFKKKLITKIEQTLFPGSLVLRLDTNFIQGIPDHIILYEDMWAAFDAKRNQFAPVRPNQPYYIDLLNKMSYASFVYPENEEKFIHEIQRSFRSNRSTRISLGK